MTLITTIPLLVALAGALIYLLTNNAKAAELGRVMFACGLLVALFGVASHVVRLS